MTGTQTVGRYHTNDSGKTLPCTAGVRECRFVHGSSPSEAADNWQAQMTHALIPEAATASRSVELLSLYRNMSLKDMDDRELSEAILLESYEVGFDTLKISESIALASELHGNQFRKGSRGSVDNPPYIEHPLRNSLRLLRLGSRKQEVIIGSVLHDTVEDGSSVFMKRLGASNREAENEENARRELTLHIESCFGTKTTEIVLAVTNDIPPANHRSFTPAEKHQIYVDHIRVHVLNSPDAFLVKLSDFIDNATGLYHGVGTMDPAKLRNQATKYLRAVPVFQEGLDRLDLDLPAHSIELLRQGLKETERRLRRIIDGWDGSDKI